MVAEQWQCSLYANVLSVQSSVPTMFLHFLQTDGLQTDGSRLFRDWGGVPRRVWRRGDVQKYV